jgi:SAM-dependent methyltransferase
MNKQTTLNHYQRKLKTKERTYNFPMFLPIYFDEMIGDKKEVTIAELGAAMFCTIGSLWNGRDGIGIKVNMYASDIKADDFNRMLKEAGVTPVVPVTKEDMENLSYPDNFFDIVHCVNALDHTQDIKKCLQEMLRVCKPGGWIYLRHYRNVGEREKYIGEHQWNIDKDYVDNADRINDVDIWNKQTQFRLSELFPNFEVKYGREFGYEAGDMVIIKIQK